jgi:hypothetical protein
MATIKLQNSKIITKSGRISCSCCCPDITLNSTGGDAGYDQTFTHQPLNEGYNIFVVFTAFFVADALSIFANGDPIYTTGCIGEEVGQPLSVSATVFVPANTTSFRIKVDPLCGGGFTSGTVWTLLVSNVCLEQ